MGYLELITTATISAIKKSKIELHNKLPENSVFILHDCELNSLILNKVKNEGSLEFSNISMNSNSSISINESNLGSSKILNCNFSHSIFEFNNSEISEIFIADTDFSKNVYLNEKINQNQARLAFGQLQKVFEKQGDSIRHYEYQAREVEAYFNVINCYQKKFPWVNFSWVALFLNKWSNNFGRYWPRGILFSFLVGGLFFNLMVNSTSKYYFTFDFNNDMFALIGPYMKFMNPLRHFEVETIFKVGDKIPDLGLTPMSHIFDFVGRVFVAYGYYQTIQAFRRFGRK
jgi:hypothetical protein